MYREMMAGLNAEIKEDGIHSIFKESTPYFFGNNLNLVYDTEMRKLKKKIDNHDIGVGALNYKAVSGVVKNEKDPVTNLYSPDLLGRKMHPTIIKSIARSDIPGIDEIKGADIDNTSTHRFLSLACNDAGDHVLKPAFDAYFKALGVLGTSDDAGQRTEMVEHCVELIKGITKVKSPFRHESTSYDKINTSDYVLGICCTSHEYESTNNTFGLSVNKKIIFASVKNSNVASHIPVCEELMIQFRKPDNGGTKFSPTLVSDSSCLVISYAISSNIGVGNATNMHLFGESALTVAFADNNGLFIQDKTKLCARMAGALCKKLLDIHSSDDVKRNAGCEYWGRIFNTEKYSGQSKKLDLIVNLLSETQKQRKLGSELIADIDQEIKTNQDAIDRVKMRYGQVTNPSDAQTQQYDEQIEVFNAIKKRLGTEKLESEAAKPESTKAIPAQLITKSFVMRQDVRSLMKVDKGQHCNIRKWISTQSFSLLALSPQAGKNYVFIVNHLGSTPTTGQIHPYILRAKRMEEELNETAYGMNFYSMFDLEQELRQINL
jgi:hypothetical protein